MDENSDNMALVYIQKQEQIAINGYNNTIRPFIDKKFINNNLNNNYCDCRTIIKFDHISYENNNFIYR